MIIGRCRGTKQKVWATTEVGIFWSVFREDGMGMAQIDWGGAHTRHVWVWNNFSYYLSLEEAIKKSAALVEPNCSNWLQEGF